jgi:hypothetical protein
LWVQVTLLSQPPEELGLLACASMPGLWKFISQNNKNVKHMKSKYLDMSRRYLYAESHKTLVWIKF